MATDFNYQTPTGFKVLTTRSLKIILAEPKERIVPLPSEEFLAGNQLPRKYYNDDCFVQNDMTCVPLEEIDSAYKNIKTFVVIGKHGTIHRYPAGNALGSLTPLNPVRKWSIYITTHWAFSMFMSAIVILNTILLVNGSGKVFDHVATIIYGMEFLLKVISAGLLRDPFTYLRKPWNWLDVVVILTSLIRPLKNISILYWARVLKVMQLTPEIRRSVILVTSTVSKLRPVLLFSIFVIFVLSLMVKLAFLGMFTRRCVSYSNYWEQLAQSSVNLNNDTTEDVVSWRDFAQNKANWFSNQWCLEDNDKNLMECLEDDEIDFECVAGVGRNPDNGITNFDSIGWSTLQTIRIINQDYLEGLISQLTNASASPTATIIYFLVIFLFGTYAFGTLAYAIVGQHVFDFLQTKFNNSATILKDQSQDEEIEDSSTATQQPSNKDHVERFVQDVLQGVVFEVLMSSTIILDTLAISLQHQNMSPFVYHFSKWMIRFAMVIYTLEFVLKIYSAGPRKYFVKGWNLFDCAVLVDMYFQIFYKKYFISLPIRIFKLTPRWNTLSLTLKIVLDSVITLWGFLGVLATFGTFCALVGTSEFRPSYLSNKHLFQEETSSHWGFADFMHSTMTVFRTWIGEFHEMLGECLLVQGGGCIIYFTTIALTGILILMTMTVGVIFVAHKTLKSRETLKWKPSILAKMFCYPYVWLRTQNEADQPKTSSNFNFKSTTFPSLSLPMNKKKVISCSPTPGGSTVLRGISSFIIIVFSLVLMLDNIPYENDINVESLVYAVDVVFTIFIAIMVGYNLVVLGAKYCVTSPGWIFDVCVVLEMIINMLYDLKPEVNPYPTFYLFRSLRPFMLVSRIEMLEIVLRGLLRELRFLWKFIIVGAFIWLYFAILGTKMFSGAFSKCELSNSTAVLYNKDECLAMNFTWMNSDLNFDHVGKSLVSLAYVGKRNSWKFIFYESLDPKIRQMLCLFVALFVGGMFLMINVIFGVLYYNLNKFEGFFVTKEHFTKGSPCHKQNPKPPLAYIKPDGKYRAMIHNFVSSVYFDSGVLVVILLDTICLAWIDAEMEFWSQDLSIARKIRSSILFVYLLELTLKLVGWGKSYFYNGWNQFDFMVVVACATEMVRLEFGYTSWIIFDFFRILRLLRIFQFQPFINRAKTLCGYAAAFKKFCLVFRNLLVFHCLMMYSYSLLGIRKFGHTKLTKGFDEYFNFRTVGSSFRVLFMLSSMAGIDEILPALTLTEENGCSQDKIDLFAYHWGDCGSMTWGTIFVYSYIFFSFLTFTNLYMFFIFEIVNQLRPGSEVVSDKVQNTANCNSNVNNPCSNPIPSTSFGRQDVLQESK